MTGMAGSMSPIAYPRRERSSADRDRRFFILLMLAPTLLLLAGLTLLPFLIGFWLSFTDYLLTAPPARFIAFGNYVELLGSAEFWTAFRVSLVFTTACAVLQTALGVAVAVLLVGAGRGQALWRTLFIAPLAITPIAAIFTFRMMFNPGLGVFNYLLRLIGIPAQNWLGTSEMAMISLVLVDTWQWTPFVLLIVAGGLASLPDEPFEAAKLDGASGWQTFRYVTLPMLKPFIAVAFLFRAIDAFKAFDLIYVLTAGGPGTATTTLNVFAYKQAIEFLQLGRGSAIAILIMVIITIVAQIFLRRSRLFTVTNP
jgi:multiple sugar transport system permease protein